MPVTFNPSDVEVRNVERVKYYSSVKDVVKCHDSFKNGFGQRYRSKDDDPEIIQTSKYEENIKLVARHNGFVNACINS